jgi:hypothetical protein
VPVGIEVGKNRQPRRLVNDLIDLNFLHHSHPNNSLCWLLYFVCQRIHQRCSVGVTLMLQV